MTCISCKRSLNIKRFSSVSVSLKFTGAGKSYLLSFRCYDLLNNKNALIILEDKNNNVQIQNLVEKQASTAQEMLSLIEFGNSVRT
jgi:hypothetical protein